jgi:hypothetical protein
MRTRCAGKFNATQRCDFSSFTHDKLETSFALLCDDVGKHFTAKQRSMLNFHENPFPFVSFVQTKLIMDIEFSCWRVEHFSE